MSTPAPPGPGLGQVGRRPTSPALLAVVAALWIGCGIVAMVALHASWRFVPGIVFLGIGVLYARGAATALLRRARPAPPGPRR